MIFIIIGGYAIGTDLSQKWLEILQTSGYRLTGSRQAVVETIAGSETILNPTEIYIRTVQTYPGLGLVTVYRTLEKLEELHLIQRVHLEGGCNYYVAAAQGHQHLLICTSCKRAQYFSGDDLSPLVEKLGLNLGYQIEGHWLQLFGRCQECQKREAGQI